ncbi:MAG TPA: epoxyqueuosine reductase QueH [Bacteroidales bacterium]|nr:epoxyqueuosine reductase QueH [Bacteroidales bacterium]HRW94256.1 epoxyqueuosine reductase QueH [Bacteroidales bacterium]
MQNDRKKLLLHVCCGPCSTTALERLYPEYDITVFYYNPNTAPQKEYLLRRDEARRVTRDIFGSEIDFLEGEYCPDAFLEAVKGYENEPEGGRRCEICFRMRLEETARYARENGYSHFCTTLTLSPHKNAILINRIGEELTHKYKGLTYLPSDFKKRNGFGRSVEISKKYELYRQEYCGCIFSMQQSTTCKENA